MQARQGGAHANTMPPSWCIQVVSCFVAPAAQVEASEREAWQLLGLCYIAGQQQHFNLQGSPAALQDTAKDSRIHQEEPAAAGRVLYVHALSLTHTRAER